MVKVQVELNDKSALIVRRVKAEFNIDNEAAINKILESYVVEA